ncbi:MAG TPA: DUF1178 family protein [Xanthobacteraceae bacterium]|jgi:hypothetical protein|nr:DUF1178 family protein [Xanthobacteraceae bacterium]
MIRYALNCDRGHTFESWFQNSAAYDKQAKRALVACPVCGSAKVEKAMMAPRLSSSADAEIAAPQLPISSPMPSRQPAPPRVPMPPAATASVAVMSPPERELRQKLKEIREHITKNASYVGTRFPEEARKIHYGETEHRSIYGEASPDEAKELYDEGIEFHPLPILPDDQN